MDTVVAREELAVYYGTQATQAALYDSVPAGAAGTEPTGGSPAYARQALTWTAGAVDGAVTATAVFDVPAGFTARGVGVLQADNSYYDGASVPEQPFTTQGTLTVTFTFTQT